MSINIIGQRTATEILRSTNLFDTLLVSAMRREICIFENCWIRGHTCCVLKVAMPFHLLAHHLTPVQCANSLSAAARMMRLIGRDAYDAP
jgi:hypothetical protein